ncbi:MAG TPA: 2,3,4,5-tetrahydropyridine-2,6-dicarboxylate N-succinyltransferase [Terriglobia bacterium]|nr:2,3,4,5-tetrahydropyridine-2,6-dicarboxylate N-succinyltransferase [Terriglobia bacterium]
MNLEQLIPLHYARQRAELDLESRQVFETFLAALDKGAIRAADKVAGKWQVNEWVKQGILLGFKLGSVADFSINSWFQFRDKDTFPLKNLQTLSHSVRLVPGGSSVRTGAYLGKNVTLMPPMYVNVGAYIDDESMVDSHALIGSCAQIGKRVHISAGTQIGGVLEPMGALPVIVEDDVLVGGNCGIYEGTVVESGAVIGAGTVITGSTPIYDLVKERIYRKTIESPLVIPHEAVVVPGSRPARGEFANKHHLQLAVPVIVKYRDQGTDARVSLEELLRS